APAAEVREGGTLRRLAERSKIRAQAVTRVEQFGEDSQLHALAMRRPEQAVGSLEVRRDVERIRGHLDCCHHNLHSRSPRSGDRSTRTLVFHTSAGPSGEIRRISIGGKAKRHPGPSHASMDYTWDRAPRSRTRAIPGCQRGVAGEG